MGFRSVTKRVGSIFLQDRNGESSSASRLSAQSPVENSKSDTLSDPKDAITKFPAPSFSQSSGSPLSADLTSKTPDNTLSDPKSSIPDAASSPSTVTQSSRGIDVPARGSYYGHVCPSILGGFHDDELGLEVEDEAAHANHRQAAEPPAPRPSEHSNGKAPATTSSPPTTSHVPVKGMRQNGDFQDSVAPREQQIFNTPTTPQESTLGRPTPSYPAKRGYLPPPASIFADFEVEELGSRSGEHHLASSTSAESPSPAASRTALMSNNPYLELLEQQNQAMTVAYLHSRDASDTSRPSSWNITSDDLSFGQRYQKAVDTPAIVVSRQRIAATQLSGSRECSICVEMRGVEEFPFLSITATCAHAPAACLTCVGTSIRSDLTSKLWTEIRCPECRESLDYVDIQKYADKETFARYEGLALRAAMAEATNFIWCTAGCGSGQIHSSGHDQPIVTCLHCKHRSCYAHNVAWHENLTCAEYDQLLADPENFRSRLEIENDEWEASRQAQLDADRVFAQGLLASEQAEIARREAREKEEMDTARKAAKLAREIAARRKLEEEQSEQTVSQTTKPCPGCGWPIEKNKGCSHMTCVKCKYEFCYDCGANYRVIVSMDNTMHKPDCPFHSDNLEDTEPDDSDMSASVD